MFFGKIMFSNFPRGIKMKNRFLMGKNEIFKKIYLRVGVWGVKGISIVPSLPLRHNRLYWLH
jgi:hypothetical protein